MGRTRGVCGGEDRGEWGGWRGRGVLCWEDCWGGFLCEEDPGGCGGEDGGRQAEGSFASFIAPLPVIVGVSLRPCLFNTCLLRKPSRKHINIS